MKDSRQSKLAKSIHQDDKKNQFEQKKKSSPSSLRFIRYRKPKKQVTAQSPLVETLHYTKPEQIVKNFSKHMFPIIQKNKPIKQTQMKYAVRQLCEQILNGNKSIKQQTSQQKNIEQLKLPFFKPSYYSSDLSQRIVDKNNNKNKHNANDDYHSLKTCSNQKAQIFKQLSQRKANFSQRFISFKEKIDKLENFRISNVSIQEYSKNNHSSKPNFSISLATSNTNPKKHFSIIDRYQSPIKRQTQPDEDDILKITKLISKETLKLNSKYAEKYNSISNSKKTLTQQINLRLKRPQQSQLKNNSANKILNNTTTDIQQCPSTTSPSLFQMTNLNLKNIKARNFIMLEHESQQTIVAHKQNISLQIASLTKIMTFYVVYKIAQQQSLSLLSQTYIVDEDIEGYSGTSAQLCSGQTYTIRDLLYGLMLPSGNDAAMCLARWGGSKLKGQTNKQKKNIFINEMNKKAKELGLKKTKFCNPHGLPHSQSKSTVEDIAKLCSICLKIDLFLHVVNTKKYRITVNNTKLDRKYEKIWQNTNKLLRRNHFIGIKTGITVTAGPCLASAYEFKNKIYIVVLARANKVSRRFKQTRYILSICLKNLYKEKLTYQEEKDLEDLYEDNRKLDSDYSDQEGQFNYHDKSPKQYRNRANIITYET